MDECKREVTVNEAMSAFYTLEKLKELANRLALEKQIPKTVLNVRESGFANMLFGDCPICKSAVYTDEKYCGQCGQALKWGE